MWIDGKELLEKFTKQQIWEYVTEGRLTPYHKHVPKVKLTPDYPDDLEKTWRIHPMYHAGFKSLQQWLVSLEKEQINELLSLATAAAWKKLGEYQLTPESFEMFLNVLLFESWYPLYEVEAVFSQAMTDQEQADTEKKAGRKSTRLTKQAKERLQIIAPIVQNFCKMLSTSIKSDRGTVTGVDADAWRNEALLRCEDADKWQKVIQPEDVRAIDFERYAVSEHKERLVLKLAKIILEREDFGKATEKELAKYFDLSL